MTYDFGSKRGTSGTSGFTVRRLKTSKKEGKYGNVKKNVKRGSETIQRVQQRHNSADSLSNTKNATPRERIFGNKTSTNSRYNENDCSPQNVSRDFGRRSDSIENGKRTKSIEDRPRHSNVSSGNFRSEKVMSKNTTPREKIFGNKTNGKPRYNENERSPRGVSRDYGRRGNTIENGKRNTGIENRPRYSDGSTEKFKPEDVKIDRNDCDEEESSNSSQSNDNSIHRRKELRKNKIEMYRKSLRENPVMAEDKQKRKRKKAGIRLDPNDISNKKIVETLSSNEKVEEKDPEISKNAQFRAIIPSSSILSTVENDLLGRRRTIEWKNAGYIVDISAPLDNIPFSTNTTRERVKESVFRNKLEFFASAKISTSFPAPVLPEIAFAGRSNVGKSSLMNALTRQWGVVRTSDKPGHTQTINFFRLASKMCMVDLPGYGFAYAKEEVKDSWEELVKEYVSTRDGLQRVCLLIDTKWGMKTRDHELVELMERSKTPYQVVLTKTDIVFPIDVARRAMQIQQDLKTMKSKIDPVMMVSSKTGAGIGSLRTVLSKLARFIKP